MARTQLSDGHCCLTGNCYGSQVAFGPTFAHDCAVQHSSSVHSFPYTYISYFLFTVLSVLSFQTGEWVIPSHSFMGCG